MKIIVSLTSWTKRIDTVIHTIQSILDGTMLPDKIVLNLSAEEFNNIELPNELLQLKDSCKIFEIYWVDGPNTKTFKKLLPTLKRYPNDIVITIDDDIIYHATFVEVMVQGFYQDPTRPITAAYNTFYNVPIPWGGAALYKSSFLAGYEKYLNEDIINTNEDDWFYFMMLLINNIKLRMAPAEICYNVSKYFTFICNDRAEYTTNRTIDVISNVLEVHGMTFEELSNNIYKKYKHSI